MRKLIGLLLLLSFGSVLALGNSGFEQPTVSTEMVYVQSVDQDVVAYVNPVTEVATNQIVLEGGEKAGDLVLYEVMLYAEPSFCDYVPTLRYGPPERSCDESNSYIGSTAFPGTPRNPETVQLE